MELSNWLQWEIRTVYHQVLIGMINLIFFRLFIFVDFVPVSNLWNPIQFFVHFIGQS